MCVVHCDPTPNQKFKKIPTGKMDDKFSLLKFYLSSSADVKQRQYQRHLPFKEKKGGSLTGPPTYAAGMTIVKKTYVRKINPSEFCKCLEQFKHIFNQVSAIGSDKKHNNQAR